MIRLKMSSVTVKFVNAVDVCTVSNGTVSSSYVLNAPIALVEPVESAGLAIP